LPQKVLPFHRRTKTADNDPVASPPEEAPKKISIMAFYKKIYRQISKKWYASAVTVGKPVTTDEVADRLVQISTVSKADTYAVLKDLAGVLADYMANGRSVKLEVLGTFYYTCDTSGMGVDTADKVTATKIKGARVRFIPETRMSGGNTSRHATRSLVSQNVF